MYQTVFFEPLSVPLYKGKVTVPFLASTVPEFSNCTGPTKLGLVVEGGGPKYDKPTVAPTDGGAGNKLQPGPGPIGPGPGPCSELKLEDIPAEEAAGVGVVADAATGRFAVRCTAIDSAEIGFVADGVTCAPASGVTRIPRNRLLRVIVVRRSARKRKRVVLSLLLRPDITDLRTAVLMVLLRWRDVCSQNRAMVSNSSFACGFCMHDGLTRSGLDSYNNS